MAQAFLVQHDCSKNRAALSSSGHNQAWAWPQSEHTHGVRFEAIIDAPGTCSQNCATQVALPSARRIGLASLLPL